MRPEFRRGFTILDVMVLLSAIASGFALVRAIGVTVGLGLDRRAGGTASLFRLVVPQLPGIVSLMIVPVLATSSLATLALGRIPPRPRWRSWIRQPGVLGLLALLVAISIDSAWYAAISLATPGRSDPLLPSAVGRWGQLGFVAIVASWMTLRLPGRWRRPLSWPDQFGLWIQIVWITCECVVMLTSILGDAMG